MHALYQSRLLTAFLLVLLASNLIFPVSDHMAAVFNIGFKPFTPQGVLQAHVIPSFSMSPPRGACLNVTASHSCLPNSVWIFLYSFGYIRVCLPVSSLFKVRISPHVDVFLMHLLGVVNSASSYSTTLISSLTNHFF